MDESFWVFAYGSLIWRPGFDYAESCPATLYGWHRAMCILSVHYRGTAAAPGLVLGLDRGGSCRGLAYRVAAGQIEAVRGYLLDREMIGGVYEPRFVRMRLHDNRTALGYVFTAKRNHAQYTGPLTPGEAVRLIRQGAGRAGSSRDYLASTVAHLDALGLHDAALTRLLRLVDKHQAMR